MDTNPTLWRARAKLDAHRPGQMVVAMEGATGCLERLDVGWCMAADLQTAPMPR